MRYPANNPRGNPSNHPEGGDALSIMLEAMSVRELTDALNDALEHISEEEYDPALIDAYLDALDRKDPMPGFPDAETSYADFTQRAARILSNLPNLPKNRTVKPNRNFYRVFRAGLAAVLAIICMFGCMVVAQTAGLNVFGTVARWTDDVFSFGEIRVQGREDIPNDSNDSDHSAWGTPVTGKEIGGEFATLQDALDAYGITEVSEPTWLPEGYALNSIMAACRTDGTLWYLAADYTNGSAILGFGIEPYDDEPHTQVEKTDAPVETFAVNGTTVYLLENINNNAAAWATEHYAYYVSGPVEKSELRKIVLSIYEN